MIVCLCHRISDRENRHAVASGSRCVEPLKDETRVASSCGCCHDGAGEVFTEACDEAPAVQPAPETANAGV